MGKNSKVVLKPGEYEGFSFGPIQVIRVGRSIVFKSSWKPGEHEEFLERVRQSRPKHRSEINDDIQKLEQLIQTYDSMELLASISLKNCFSDPEQYTEITHKGRESYVEYAQSLALARPRGKQLQHASKDACEEFESLIKKVMDNVVWYFGSEIVEKRRSKTEEELRFLCIASSMFVRGDSYASHHEAMIRELFQEHDALLRKRYGVTTENIIKGVADIERQIESNIQKQISMISALQELHEMFINFTNEHPTSEFHSLKELKEAYFAVPEVSKKRQEFDVLATQIAQQPFEIRPAEALSANVLELLSLEYGQNAMFVKVSSWEGWPLNDSAIHKRPVVKTEDGYYCFAPQIAFRQMSEIFESLIREADEGYFQTTYQIKRAEYLEDRAIKYLSSLLPGASVFRNVYYHVKDDEGSKRRETDGLIMWDENLLILEAKAGDYSRSARRGGVERLKRNLTDLIDDAYKQALRTRDYINSCERPVFEDERGQEVLVIEDKQKYRNIFLINVTLENLGLAAVHLASLKGLALLEGKEWPWSVFANDLRVISEIFESPSQFIHFLKRRIEVHNYPAVRSCDELDLMMLYLNEGLYFEESSMKGLGAFTLLGYTEDLDRYFHYREGRVTSGKKPRSCVLPEYQSLIERIERTGKRGFSRLTSCLLDYDGYTQRELIRLLKSCIELASKDGKAHDFTMGFKLPGDHGITVAVASGKPEELCEKRDGYCRLKMYQMRVKKWYLIGLSCDDEEKIDFNLYEQEWKFSQEMEERLNRFRARKMTAFGKGKVGRNAPCPCDSMLKFKRCCGK